MEEHSIPKDLVINWDQTGTKLVPVNSWMLEDKGSKQVAVVGKDNKRKITSLLAVSADGALLPPQVIYKGNTSGCHAKVTFPADWNVTHSPSHWSTEETMLEFLDAVIIPYVERKCKELKMSLDQPALAICDVSTAHRCDSVLQKLTTNNIRQVFIPGGCTAELQPLDLSVNEPFKFGMKDSFATWYAESVKTALDAGESFESVKIDLKASTVKPRHANWLISAVQKLSSMNCLEDGFRKAGILECFK